MFSLVTSKNAIICRRPQQSNIPLTYRLIPLTWTIVYWEIHTLPSREPTPFGRNALGSRPFVDVSFFPLPAV
jgi:hypothetical protein